MFGEKCVVSFLEKKILVISSRSNRIPFILNFSKTTHKKAFPTPYSKICTHNENSVWTKRATDTDNSSPSTTVKNDLFFSSSKRQQTPAAERTIRKESPEIYYSETMYTHAKKESPFSMRSGPF